MTPQDAILRMLREHDGWVSGEDMARAIACSRAAVAKHVRALRARGWGIDARRRLGYRVRAAPDLLEAAVVGPLLGTRWLGRDWRWSEAVGSTNDEARRAAEQGAPHGAVFVAEEQTRGRGRLGRAWHSPPRANLYLSAVLRPRLPPGEAAPVTLAAGVAVAEAVEAAGAEGVTLKWPNDVRAGGRKIAGILTELVAEADRVRFLVVGIGVNLNGEAFPAELAAAATSLRRETGRFVHRAAFAAALCARIEAWIDRFVAEGGAPAVAAFRALAELGRAVRVDTGSRVVEGVAEDVDAVGALLVRTATGEVARVTSGDVLRASESASERAERGP